LPIFLKILIFDSGNLWRWENGREKIWLLFSGQHIGGLQATTALYPPTTKKNGRFFEKMRNLGHSQKLIFFWGQSQFKA
jgi:hypothetical protein